MNQKTQSTRYLLGELTDAEQAAFEAAYFDDERLFAELTETEHALVDDYVRDRLPLEVRTRLEQVYLNDPRRSKRVRFAAALTSRIDPAGPYAVAEPPRPLDSRVASEWHQSLFGQSVALRWSLASLMVLAIASGVWFFIESSRTRRESTQVESAPPPVSAPVVPVGPTAARVSPPAIFALTVGTGVRGIDPRAPVTLVVPAGTEEVQLALSLEERDYASYRVLLSAIGGAEILRQGDLKPDTNRAAAAFTVKLPASRLESGDYMLTLQGARAGEFDDLSQSLFRIDKK